MYSYNNEYPINSLPFRIVLSDGRTRTNPSSFTQEEWEDAGYLEVADKPAYDASTQVLEWLGVNGWNVRSKTTEELQQDLTNHINKTVKQINKIRDNNIYSEKYFAQANAYFDCDDTAIRNIQATFSLAVECKYSNTEFTVNYTDANNITHSFDANTTIEFGKTVFHAIKSQYEYARSVKDDVLDASSISEIDSIFSAAYPDN